MQTPSTKRELAHVLQEFLVKGISLGSIEGERAKEVARATAKELQESDGKDISALILRFGAEYPELHPLADQIEAARRKEAEWKRIARMKELIFAGRPDDAIRIAHGERVVDAVPAAAPASADAGPEFAGESIPDDPRNERSWSAAPNTAPPDTVLGRIVHAKDAAIDVATGTAATTTAASKDVGASARLAAEAAARRGAGMAKQALRSAASLFRAASERLEKYAERRDDI